VNLLVLVALTIGSVSLWPFPSLSTKKIDAHRSTTIMTTSALKAV
jgi:hypothetical protein